MLKITDGRDAFFQWDTSQTLTVENEPGETVAEVHIGHEHGDVYSFEPANGVVTVPDELLQCSDSVIAFEWLSTAEGGYTTRKHTFRVAKRPKVDNYTYTPTKAQSWEYWSDLAKSYAERAELALSEVPGAMRDYWREHKDDFKGDPGPRGETGPQGVQGIPGVAGLRGPQGEPGRDGRDGKDGKDGRDGIDAQPYDDTEIRSEINRVNESITELDERVEVLERGGGSGYDDREIRGEIAELSESITEISESSTEHKTENVDIIWHSGYVDSSGNVTDSASSSLQYSDRISVGYGDKIYFPTISGQESSLRFLTMYYNGAISPTPIPSNLNGIIMIPQNVDEVIVTVYKSRNYIYLIHEYDFDQLLPKGVPELKTRISRLENNSPYFATLKSDSINSVSMKMNIFNNCRKNEVLAFCGKVSSDFVSLEVGFSKQKNALDRINRVVVNTTNLAVYGILSSPTIVAHGLTIENDIAIKWVQNEKANGVIVTLTSNGKSFTTQEIYYGKNAICTPYAVGSGTITDCTLSYTCRDMRKSLWIIGDSYTSWDSAGKRWLYYAFADGITENFYLDGLSGGNSEGGYNSFEDLVDNFAIPKYVVWILGMNDGSDSLSSPSTMWATNRDKFISKCESMGIEPIFGTIPTVPTINNEKKNEWIRNSGYRYIDFAKAVGANQNGVWYGDMLSSDGVHPSADGAKTLYNCLINELPEIFVK